jgi:hypothetical protein
MEARELNFFRRFLKEKGLYSAFVRDARRQQNWRLKKPYQEYIRGMNNSTGILMAVVHWGESEYKYWHTVYDDYKIYFRKNYYNNI